MNRPIPVMTQDDIDLAIVRIDGALANQGAISFITAEGWGQSCRDVPVSLTFEESAAVFLALREVLQRKGEIRGKLIK